MVNATVVRRLVAPLIAVLTGCAPTPSDIQTMPDDTWTWQVDRNYQWFAQCLTDALNSAPQHSWFFQAPRPITTFEQQWSMHRIVLKSIDPAGVEQVRVQIVGVSDRSTRVIAVAKNLEALGGGGSMIYVRGYVEECSRS